MELSGLSSTELSRLCAHTGDLDAWKEFIRRFQKIIAVTVFRVSRQCGSVPNAVVDDLVQETYLRLCADNCRLLRDFKPSLEIPDSLGALVRVVAASVTYDHFRHQSALKRGGNRQRCDFGEVEDHHLSDLWNGAHHIERETQLRQIEQTLDFAPEEAISVRERTIFRLYFRQGLTASSIASIPTVNLTTKGVESAIHRITKYLKARLALGPEDREGKCSQFSIEEEGES